MNDFFQTLFGCLSSMYEQGWDNFLYDNGAYTYFGLILLIVPSIIAGIFYFADTARFNGRLKWFLFMLISFLLVMAITYGVPTIWISMILFPLWINLAQRLLVASGEQFGSSSCR